MNVQGLLPTKRDSYGRLILGDIITSINGKKVSNGTDLYRILDQCKVGEKVIHASITKLCIFIVGLDFILSIEHFSSICQLITL